MKGGSCKRTGSSCYRFDDVLISYGVYAVKKIYEGTYRPKPVYIIKIPKPDGDFRELGISPPLDRFFQQAFCQVLYNVYDDTFSEHSHGFRRSFGVTTAVSDCLKYVEDGYLFAAHLDIKKCFDTLNHNKLTELLLSRIDDGRMILMLRRFFAVGSLADGEFIRRNKGVAQGGALSPLLSNIYLNELDCYFERNNIKFVRYADDVVVLKEKLYLELNMSKVKLKPVRFIDFLGYGFVYDKVQKRYTVCISQKAIDRIIKRLEEKVNDKFFSISEVRDEVNQYFACYAGARCCGEDEPVLQAVDEAYIKVLNKRLWREWYKSDVMNQQINLLGLHPHEIDIMNGEDPMYWNDRQLAIACKYINKKVLSAMEFNFIADTFEKAKVRRCAKELMYDEAFLR